MISLQLFLVCLWVLLKCASSWKELSLHPVNLFLTPLVLQDSACGVPSLPVTDIRVGDMGSRLLTEPLLFKRTTLNKPDLSEMTVILLLLYSRALHGPGHCSAAELIPLRAYITFSQLVILSSSRIPKPKQRWEREVRRRPPFAPCSGKYSIFMTDLCFSRSCQQENTS